MAGLRSRAGDIDKAVEEAVGGGPPQAAAPKPAPPALAEEPRRKPGFFERLNPFARQKAQAEALRQ